MKRDSTWYYYLLVLPALALSLSVILVPTVMTVFTSFSDWNGLSANMNFVGWSNYKELFGDRVFRHALTNNFKWMGLFLTVPMFIGLLSATLLMRRKRSRGFYQVTYLFPYVIAPIANAMLWLYMIFNPAAGVFGFLRSLGWNVSSPFSNTSTALFGVAGVDIWHYWGFLAVVLLAALRQTPEEQTEAANVEGASGWQVFRYVYFPNILPTVRLLMILIIIQSFLTFDYIYLLTKGGPAHATEMLSTLTYEYAFSAFRFGKASASAIVMSLLGLSASLLYLRFSRSEEQR